MNFDKSFLFQEQSCTIQQLLESKTLKVYWKQYRSERKLICDAYNRLFVYNYEEDMSFNDGPDREDHLWVAVSSLEEADRLQSLSNLELIRPPYIAADETGWIHVQED